MLAPPYTVWRFVVKIYNRSLSEFLPSECVSCSLEGPWLCDSCQDNALRITRPTCPFCNKLSPNGKTCPTCASRYALNGLRASYYYDGTIPALVHRYKYQGVLAVREFICPELGELTKEIPLTRGTTPLLTSVPSTSQRLVARGYNQSEALAQAIAFESKIPYQPLLKRHGPLISQTQLTRSQRFHNVQDQFSLLSRRVDLSNYTIIICDDVFTTGATTASCAAILKQAGARAVWALTIAKD